MPKYRRITCFYSYNLLKYTAIKHEKYFSSYQKKHTTFHDLQRKMNEFFHT